MAEVFGRLTIRELIFELIGIDIELRDHIINVLYVVLEVVLRFFDSLIPQHC